MANSNAFGLPFCASQCDIFAPMATGGAADGRRERNRERVTAALREAGSASRSELARRTGMSRTTVSSIVGELEAAGVLIESEVDSGASPRGGRPPRRLSFSRAAGVAIGIDFGKRHLGVAAADLSHTILAEAQRPVRAEDPAEAGLDAAVALVEEVMERAGVTPEQVVGVGLGLPGPIDRRSGRVGSSSILPGWVGVRAADELGKRLSLPVAVDNDANLGALAELHWGAAAGRRDVAYLKISTGIGAGLVLDGRVYHGTGGLAGEIGHAIVDEQGPVCRCGKRGCLETLAGASALAELLEPRLGRAISTAELLSLATSGDSGARRVIADAGRHIGGVVATLCDLFNPELIVVGGELGRAGDVLLDPMREQVHRNAIPATARDVEIVEGVLGPRAELLGALALVLAYSPSR
jgi:predicted NBD/HSP70 family sugar kinase/biotin operon repressor